MTNTLWIGASTLICVGISAVLTLAKVVFGTIVSNYDESKENEPHLRKIHALVETPPFYEVISLGRIVSNSTAAVLGLFLFSKIGPVTPWTILDGFLWLALTWHVLYIFVVFIPSLLGNLRPYSLAFPTLILFRLASIIFHPPAKLSHRLYHGILAKLGYDPRLQFLTEDQREMLESDTTSTEEDSSLEEDERQMILNIFDFVETPVREIMTPRVDMLVLEASASLKEVVAFLNHERHSRVPVYKDSIDNIIGVLHNRDFLHWFTEHPAQEFNLETILKPAIFVPYHKKIDDLLRDFRHSANQLAIVVDEYGGTAGLVTMEDILEEIVGDIKDEDDRDEEQPIARLKDGNYMVDPYISLSDLEFELDLHLEAPQDSHVETLSGFIHATLGSLPIKDAVIDLGPCKVKILEVEGTRMEKLLLMPNKPA
jgi:CBS domain containing-hemolysin-like protein